MKPKLRPLSPNRKKVIYGASSACDGRVMFPLPIISMNIEMFFWAVVIISSHDWNIDFSALSPQRGQSSGLICLFTHFHIPDIWLPPQSICAPPSGCYLRCPPRAVRAPPAARQRWKPVKKLRPCCRYQPSVCLWPSSQTPLHRSKVQQHTVYSPGRLCAFIHISVCAPVCVCVCVWKAKCVGDFRCLIKRNRMSSKG